jgi:hypothetical protein
MPAEQADASADEWDGGNLLHCMQPQQRRTGVNFRHKKNNRQEPISLGCSGKQQEKINADRNAHSSHCTRFKNAATLQTERTIHGFRI